MSMSHEERIFLKKSEYGDRDIELEPFNFF